MAEAPPTTAAALNGLIAACDRALVRLLDPDLPGVVDPVLIEQIRDIRGRAVADLGALGPG